jgi:alpha-L-fucosidase
MPHHVPAGRARPLALVALVTLLLFSAEAFAQPGYQPSPENLKSRQWFLQARFGMFIHWGIYSELGDGEWVMQNHHIPGWQYEVLAAQFYPAKYDPAQWVSLAKQAGMRYIVLTARHHDGFSMFATRQNKYNVVDATPYGKDILRQLADECHRQGIKLFVYYSQLDWHHPDYFPLGDTGQWFGRPHNGQWPRYLDFMNAQLTELLSNYGEIGGVWFDGMWDRPDADWQLPRTYGLIHQLQPGALIVSNHHKTPFPGEDYQTFEKDLPGANTTGWGGAPVSQLPLETNDTMYPSGSWGFDMHDLEPKSLRDLIQYLVRAAGNNANFLLNVGPMPNGEIQPAFANRLREIGEWMKSYGDSIYGTTGGPVKPGGWGATTQRGDTIYVHVLDPALKVLALPELPTPVHDAHLLSGGSNVPFRSSSDGLVLQLPPRGAGEIDQVIVLKLGS